MAHQRWQRAIDRLFTARLSVRAWRRLTAHLHLCPDCRHLYARYALIEAAAAGSYPFPATAARERAARRLQESLALARRPAARKAWWLAVPAIGAVAAAVLLWLTLAAPARILAGAHVPLGADRALVPLATKGVEVASSAEIGIRAFVVKYAGARDRVEPAGELGTADIITFSYTNGRPEIGYLLLFGLQPDGRVILYHPAHPAERSLPIERGVVDRPLRDGIRLSANHAAGPLRVVGWFSREPLEVERKLLEVRRAIRKEWFEGEPAPLPVPGALEHSILLKLEEAPGQE